MTPTAVSSPRYLYHSITAVVLSFIPFLCIGGAILGYITLQKALKTKDTTTKVLSIIALIVGALNTLQTIFIVLFFFPGAVTPSSFEAGQ